MSTLRRLLALAGMPARRVGLSVLLGALAVGFGVALMATAGYLISRAAEHPPILSLTVTIVLVRFFGLARPIARYLERLASHDLALRALARIRARFYARIEPLAPAELGAFRRGDLLSRMVGDVDTLQGLYLRGVGPPLVACPDGSRMRRRDRNRPARSRRDSRCGSHRRRNRRPRARRVARPGGGTAPGRGQGRAQRIARGDSCAERPSSWCTGATATRWLACVKRTPSSLAWAGAMRSRTGLAEALSSSSPD